MKLAELTWPEVDALDRSTVVVIATGSIEQHGAHLPLATDSLLVTSVMEAVEARLPDRILLTPTMWLGASGHHLGFAGSLSASFEGYEDSLIQIVENFHAHGFHRFYIVNGHGGNTEPNGIVCRKLKSRHPEIVIGHSGYFAFLTQATYDAILTGSIKGIRHACEAETSLMMHLHPTLVRLEKRRDDGLEVDPPVPGMVFFFDECTEAGSFGDATQASANKGKVLFDEAVDGLTQALTALHHGISLQGR